MDQIPEARNEYDTLKRSRGIYQDLTQFFLFHALHLC